MTDTGTRLAMPPEAMRRLAHDVVDRLIDRWTGLDAEAAWRGATRAELEARLREPPPARGVDPARALDRLVRDVLPFAARVDHPRFMAFVPGSPTWPGVLADLLAAGYNTFQGTWLGGAGPSAIELVVLDWFRDWLGLPAGAGGLFLSGGSVANLTALAAARLIRDGGHDRAATLYFSSESHSAVSRAVRFLGFHEDQVRVIPADAAFCLPVDAVAAAIDADIEAGRRPLAVVANAGTTSTGAVDPLPALAALCRARGVWLHVDAAYGGFAILAPAGVRALAGIEQADSIALDPHKWLYQPFEAGCLMVRDVRALERAMHVMPDYLLDAAIADRDDALRPVNFADRGPQLTRSPRALKVWLSIQCFGLDAFREAVARTLDLAARAEARIRADDAFALATPASLGIVCFTRRTPGLDPAAADAVQHELVRGLAASGVGMISSTRIDGRTVLRLCILNHSTRHTDVERVLDWLREQPVHPPASGRSRAVAARHGAAQQPSGPGTR